MRILHRNKILFFPIWPFLGPFLLQRLFSWKGVMHVTLYEVSGESQFSDSVWCLYDFANLLCKTVKCHEGSFLKNKISFAEEVIGNIIKSWKPHIDFVSKKISKSVGIIAKARFYLSSQTLMTLYYSHVYPFLTYCNVAWPSTYRSSVNCIYLLPKRLVRLITKPHYLAKTTPLFSRLKVLVKDWNDLPVTLAGNLIANFWKKSNPQPMHCLPPHPRPVFCPLQPSFARLYSAAASSSERLRSDGSVATSFGLYVICSQLFSSCIWWSYSYFQLFYILSLSYSHRNSRQQFPSQWELSY